MSRLFRTQLVVTGLMVGIVPLGPLGWLAAQTSGQASGSDKRIERARLIEESEQDLAAAEAIYREIIADRATSKATKTHARLRLGLCLLDQGREDEGKAALEAAAGGQGPHAEEARSVLDGRAAAKQRLETMVGRLLDEIPTTSDSLIEIGDPAVPYMLEALRSSGNHTRTLHLIDGLLYIGSQQVVTFVDSVVQAGDVYLERLFLQRISRLTGFHPDGARAFTDVVRALLPLVRTAELKTRRKVVELAVGVITVDELLELVVHPDRYVRDHALSEIAGRGELDNSKIMAIVGPIVETFIGNDDEGEDKILREYLENDGILTTRQGKDLVLATLRARLPVSMRGIQKGFRQGHFLAASDLATLCRDLGPTSGELDQAIRESIHGSSSLWKGDAIGDVLTMIRSGYGWEWSPLVKVLVETAGDEHYALVAEDLDIYGENLQYVLYWMANHKATPAALPALERAVTNPELLRRLAGTQAREEPEEETITFASDDPWGHNVALNAIASLGTKEAADALVRLVRLVPDVDDLASSRLLQGPPAFDGALLPLLATTPDSLTRGSTLYRLAKRGIYNREAVRQAFERGMRSDVDYFVLLFSTFDENTECRYDRATVLEIVEIVLESKDSLNWQNLAGVLVHVPKNDEKIPRRMIERLFERSLENPDRVSRPLLVHYLLQLGDTYSAAKRDLFRRTIESGEGDLVIVAIKNARTVTQDLEQVRSFLKHPDPDVARAALVRIASIGDSEYVPWLADALEHPVSSVRQPALQSVYQLGGDDSLSFILSLRQDPSRDVRRALFYVLGRSAAPEAADALVEGLRDEDKATREVAQTSLKKIEEYYEHRRRWEQLKNAFSVEDGTAEEALIRLAKSAKSKKGRLAAIRSLGTLAVPDTLPFLIVLMEDEDAEIAKAAEETVDRINSKSP